MKKIITLIMAFLVCAAMAVPAFASTADTTITGFSVNVYSYHRLTPRTKDDSSAVYFYYRDGKRDHIRARALGGSAQNGSMNNCTVSGGTRVNYVTCHNGNKYSIHSSLMRTAIAGQRSPSRAPIFLVKPCPVNGALIAQTRIRMQRPDSKSNTKHSKQAEMEQ